MKTTYLENVTVALATIVTGIMAGFFYTYSFNINLAMAQVDGATYATVQSLFNQNVRHLYFFMFFFGGGAVSVIALACNWKHYRTASFWLMALAGLLYIVGIIIFTANVNLPLNAFTESWNPQALPSDWRATRDAWNNANAVRVAVSFTAFLLYVAVFVIRTSRPVATRYNQ